MALIQRYLFFNGRCDEAIAFHQRAPGAKTTMAALTCRWVRPSGRIASAW